MPYNPKSRKNLKPRQLYYDQPKGRHEVVLTPDGWDGFKDLASSMGLSASELIERLGRRSLSLQEAMGDQPQGDTLTITKWGIEYGDAVDPQGRQYKVKRLKP